MSRKITFLPTFPILFDRNIKGCLEFSKIFFEFEASQNPCDLGPLVFGGSTGPLLSQLPQIRHYFWIFRHICICVCHCCMSHCRSRSTHYTALLQCTPCCYCTAALHCCVAVKLALKPSTQLTIKIEYITISCNHGRRC
jgi:hypothetical protein